VEHRRHYLVSGRVQGVGYRAFVVRAALSVGVSGWVRNLDDGRVELEAQGTPERLAGLERMIAAGPAHAEVLDVEIFEREPQVGAGGFSLRT
jgi:acylphosphatase